MNTKLKLIVNGGVLICLEDKTRNIDHHLHLGLKQIMIDNLYDMGPQESPLKIK